MALAYRSPLLNSHSAEHIMLIYRRDYERDNAVIGFINDGLKRNQICVYAVVSMDEKTIVRMSTEITSYTTNIEQGNLLMMTLRPFYNATGFLNPTQFEDIRVQLEENMARNRSKQILFIGDLDGFLFKNKKFGECKFLEEWWQKKPFEGSYICTYHDSILNEYPYTEYKDGIFRSHDKVMLC